MDAKEVFMDADVRTLDSQAPQPVVTSNDNPQEGKVLLKSYNSYDQAQFAVDKLSDNNFPVQSTAIVAEDLKMVEQVTGKLTNWRAFFNGAFSGSLIGAFIGFLMGILNLFQPIISAAVLAFYGLLLGAFVGAVMSLIGYSLAGGKRDFSSVKSLQANRYTLMVEANLKIQAETILARN